MATKENPFRAKIKKKPLRKFGAKTVDKPVFVKRRIKEGDTVRISNIVPPPYGSGRVKIVTGVVDAVYDDMHYFVVLRSGERRQYTTPGTFKMRVVNEA